MVKSKRPQAEQPTRILTGSARGSWVCLLCVKMNGYIMVTLIQLQSPSERLLLLGLLASQRNQLRPQREPGSGMEGQLNMPLLLTKGLGPNLSMASTGRVPERDPGGAPTSEATWQSQGTSCTVCVAPVSMTILRP